MTKQDKLSVCLGPLPGLESTMGAAQFKRMEEKARKHIVAKNTSFYRTRLESRWARCVLQYDVPLITTGMSRQDKPWTYVSRWPCIWICAWLASRAPGEAVKVVKTRSDNTD